LTGLGQINNILLILLQEKPMGMDFKVEGHIAFFTINNPATMNALDAATLKQFQIALNTFESDTQIWVGIISGAGKKAFCSGMDLKNPPDANSSQSSIPTLMRGFETNKPLIAAVNGPALGGGLELMLACDIRIAVSTASFGFPEVKLGLIPGWGGTQRIIRQLAWSQASALLLTGQTIEAKEAWRIGLINQMVPFSELIPTARHWADMICQAAPLAVQAAKEAISKGSQLSLNEGLQLEDALCAYLKTTSDFKEGMQAFRDGRPPDFNGQ
jgi:enoyl-CoA hydratase/carnithine racemase